MIVIDTSALIAIAQQESEAQACIQAIDGGGDLVMSAATLAEALIVSGSRGLSAEMSTLLTRLAVTVVPVFEGDARRLAGAHARWGKVLHPAGLNFGDCFSYALAKERGCSLLFVGNDFARTDIESALK